MSSSGLLQHYDDDVDDDDVDDDDSTAQMTSLKPSFCLYHLVIKQAYGILGGKQLP